MDVSLAFCRHVGHMSRRDGPFASTEGVESFETYTSTGVRAPWVIEQQTAPAKANREYRSKPVGPAGFSFAPMAAFAASTLDEPVPVGGADVAIMTVWVIERQRMERRVW
jgi:hypothetical protein